MSLSIETQFFGFPNNAMKVVNVLALGSETRPGRKVNSSIMQWKS